MISRRFQIYKYYYQKLLEIEKEICALRSVDFLR